MYDLVIKNVKLPNETLTDIRIENGVITHIEAGITDNRADVLDAEGHYALPGLIDMDCDCCDPGFENKEDLNSASKSAAKGGFTSLTCKPNTQPVVDNKTVVNYLLTQSNRESVVHIFPYGSITRGCEGTHMAEIGEMRKAGIVAVTNAGCLHDDAALLRNVLMYTRMFNIPVITVCHDPVLAADGVINNGAVSVRRGLKGIPREAEETAVARNIILAQYTNAQLHIAPVSTRGSVALIRQAKRDGINITCGTCPHYFTLTEENADAYNTLAKTIPPLRTHDDTEAIIEGLLDGTIDVIASGHAPDTVESVSVEFDRASFALSALETAFPVAYTALVASGMMRLDALVDKMSARPASILTLEGKGHIAVGYNGDIFLLDTAHGHIVDAKRFASKAKFSPYDGQELACTVSHTLVNGRIVYINENHQRIFG